MRVAIATFSVIPDGGAEAALLRRELAGLGVEAVAVPWDDAGTDWAAFDLVVVRSTWDYTERREEFLEWAAGVPRLRNAAPVLRWNTDKTYLRELAEAGVPVVPTLWDPADIPAGWDEYVIKPSVSCGSRDTARWRRGDEDRARAHLRRLREEGRTVMAQPYLSAIDTEGETALLFCDGEFSHAARKTAILAPGAGVPDRPVGGDTVPVEATPEQLAVAREVLAHAPGDLLYARVDLVPGPDGSPVLLELELTEPNLFLEHDPGAAARYAKAIAARL
ncbi:ATP-grasp domain-containing protein [Actinomadura kijaniata]|uniref:ATP-grasp domain-containing protein n=1 Tax=Actinomadura kijaniata TaxID=46161 RepID=UPI003F1AEA4E